MDDDTLAWKWDIFYSHEYNGGEHCMRLLALSTAPHWYNDMLDMTPSRCQSRLSPRWPPQNENVDHNLASQQIGLNQLQSNYNVNHASLKILAITHVYIHIQPP